MSGLGRPRSLSRIVMLPIISGEPASGVRRTEGGNRTIMSYLVSPDCAAPCPRILNYSNSQVVVDWFRTGVANTQENARTINDYGPTAAQYRASLGRIFYDGFEP